MKFHCDRCKTRYSIADDRVRGKILKIRCKNCSSVITVREQEGQEGAVRSTTEAAGSGAVAPPIPGAALKKKSPGPAAAPNKEISVGASSMISTEKVKGAAAAHKPAPPSPPPAPKAAPAPGPETLETEWYVSANGDQSGPFKLEEAKAWIRERPAEDELHCWSEGFDDWLPVDKVSHFRGTRQPSAGAPTFDGQGDWGEDENTVIEDGDSLSGGAPGAAPSFGTPVRAGQPLPPELAAKRPATAPPAPKGGSKPLLEALNDDDSPSLEFDIGEASRVVSLPLLLASRGNGPGNGVSAHARAATPGLTPPPEDGAGTAAAALPGSLGRGSGASPALGASMTGAAPGMGGGYATGAMPALDEPTLHPETPRRRRGGWLPLAIGGGALALVAGLFIAMSSGGDDDGSKVTRGSVGGGGNLGYSFTNPEGKGVKGPAKVDEIPDEDTKRVKNGSGGGKKGRPSNGGNGSKVTTNGGDTGTKIEDPFDEVQLGGDTETGPTGPLDGDDLMQVYRKNQIAIKMCLERALKRDPLLKVPKTWVSISVTPDGTVSKVEIPTLKGTTLGTCLTSRIKRWKFRKSTEVFTSRFPVVFDS